MPALDGRTIRLQLDVTVRPPPDAELGKTDAAMEIGRRQAIEASLLARRMAGGLHGGSRAADH